MRPELRAALLAAALAAMPVPGAAEPEPFPEFTFKRVKPPEAGSAKRITVQITEPSFMLRRPGADSAAEDDTPPPADGEPGSPGSFAWFWEAVSPQLTRASPGRLEEAARALRNAPPGAGVRVPRLERLQEISTTHARDILLSTLGTRVSPALVLAVISVESSGRAAAVSSAGAQGLMQLMPATAARFGVDDAFAPADNIRGGVAYLDFLLSEFGYDPVLALAAYNAGEGAVTRHGGVPPYAETRDYVPKVLATWEVARGLCQTPPELVTDPCVLVRARGS